MYSYGLGDGSFVMDSKSEKPLYMSKAGWEARWRRMGSPAHIIERELKALVLRESEE